MNKKPSHKEPGQKKGAVTGYPPQSGDDPSNFLKTLPVMAHSIDKAWVIQDVSHIWLAKMGYEKDEVIGRKSIEFLTEKSRNYAQKVVLPIFFEKGTIENVAYQFVTKDKHIIDVLMSAVSLRDRKGDFLRSIAIMTDVTEEKRSNDLLKAEKKFLKEAQALTKVGGWALCVQSGAVTWTDEVYQIYDVKPDEYCPGNMIRNMDIYSSKDRPKLKQALQRAKNQGVPFDLELSLLPSNDRQTWVRIIGKPEIKNGQVVITGKIVDITERILLKRKFKQAITLFKNVYESLDEAIFVVDPVTRLIISCNTAAEMMFGYKKDEMIGRNTFFLHVNQEKYVEFGEKVNSAFRTKDLLKTEYVLKKKSGETFFSCHTVKRHRKKVDNEVIHISVIRDITERKKTISALEKKEAVLSLKSKELEEMNSALKVLLRRRDQEKKDLEEGFSESINSLILPYLEQIKKTHLNGLQTEYFNILESNLKEIMIPYQHRLSGKLLNLTPAETQVVNYVKQGLRTKQISEILNVSSRTIEFHRQNIRKKLCLKNRNINLRTFLKNTLQY